MPVPPPPIADEPLPKYSEVESTDPISVPMYVEIPLHELPIAPSQHVTPVPPSYISRVQPQEQRTTCVPNYDVKPIVLTLWALFFLTLLGGTTYTSIASVPKFVETCDIAESVISTVPIFAFIQIVAALLFLCCAPESTTAKELSLGIVIMATSFSIVFTFFAIVMPLLANACLWNQPTYVFLMMVSFGPLLLLLASLVLGSIGCLIHSIFRWLAM